MIFALDEEVQEEIKNIAYKNFIYQKYNNSMKNDHLNLTIYSRFKQEVKPIEVAGTKTIQMGYRNGKYSFKIMTSDAFIEKHFGIHE